MSPLKEDRPELLPVDGLVTMVLLWPTKREMCSRGTPLSESSA
ncbi:hypothetical protein OG589_32685 [Sphaerisporangium sp. NBC_01403]